MSFAFDSDPCLKVAAHTLELEMQRFCSELELDPRTLRDNSRVDVRMRETGDLVVSLLHHVYGLRRTQVVEYPADWWQAFKAQCFPRWYRLGRWLLRRYPVRLTRVEVVAWALFPELEVCGRNTRIMYRTEQRRMVKQ